MADKIIQIISAKGIYAVYKTEKGKEFKRKLTLLALTDEGIIFPLDGDDYGVFSDPTDAKNFVRLEYK